MRLNITPIDKETLLNEGELIISKTDITGKITYANKTFMRIAQLGESELLGVQHNIIRHPDMPRGAFKLLWDTLEQGKEFFAYVKNMSKDGGYYWVYANVTPDYDCFGQLAGYYSVRRKPSRKAIEVITPVYQAMRTIEAQYRPKEALVKSQEYLMQQLDAMGVTYQQLMYDLASYE